MPTVNVFIVDSAIALLRVVLQALEIPFSLFQAAIADNEFPSLRPNAKTIVIVGGNFAGLAALKYLKSHNNGSYRVVLIDQRSYSEYTPGILRLFCAPNEFSDLAQPLPCSQTNFRCIQGKVISLIDDQGKKVLSYTTTEMSTKKTLQYDYAIVATGSTYNDSTPISASSSEEMTYEGRLQGWRTAHQQLATAKNVIILGGGAVGVELAAEIAEYMPETKVTLLDASPRLVSNFSTKVSEHALQWLTKHGVDVRLGQSLKSWTDTSCTLQDGSVLEADLVYVCFGSKPNSDMMKTKQALWCSLTKRQNIQVKDTLEIATATTDDSQLGALGIFACGDVALPPSSGEDQAFQAETQGKVAATNVLKMLQSASTQQKANLYRYPQDVAFGKAQMPMVYILSLGKHDGVLGFNSLIIPGPLAAIAKFVLEFTKVLDMRGSLLGKLIWKLADAVVLFLSSTVLPPASKDATTTQEIKAA